MIGYYNLASTDCATHQLIAMEIAMPLGAHDAADCVRTRLHAAMAKADVQHAGNLSAPKALQARAQLKNRKERNA